MSNTGVRRRSKANRDKAFFDYSMLFIVIFLVCFGLVMLYSVSSYESVLHFGDSAYYFKKQAQSTLFGFVMMFVVMMLDYHIWQKLAIPAYVVSAVLILLVLTPLGYEVNGARRWLNVGISLQPAEVAKVGMIIFFAGHVCKMGKSIQTLKGVVKTLLLGVPISFMVLTITDNLSTAIIIFGIIFMMVFVATPNYKEYFIIGGGVVGIAAIFVMLVKKGVLTSEQSYRFGRIEAWLNPEAYAGTTGFQTLQALYALGSGEIFGKGLGQSMQKLGFVPEAQNDMVFSIICEELGLFGAAVVLMMFLMLIWRFLVVANNAEDMYGALLVVGVMAHISLQVILNVAVVTNLIPNTGITLPFISYGGSAVVFLLIEIGLVFSVARRIRLRNSTE
ncbi:MAG: putative lipid II flippase FtsW [Lachnospiraceae bacterium]|nr:putative lipid II flippase FtsW [Lachnospiraceae bacterium]